MLVNMLKENKNPDVFQEITYSGFMEMKDNSDTYVVLIHQDGCSHCEKVKPLLNNVIKDNDLLVYAINLSDLEEGESDKLYKKTFVNGTPTIVYFEEGKLQANKLIGSKSESEIKNYFEEIGYIE